MTQYQLKIKKKLITLKSAYVREIRISQLQIILITPTHRINVFDSNLSTAMGRTKQLSKDIRDKTVDLDTAEMQHRTTRPSATSLVRSWQLLVQLFRNIKYGGEKKSMIQTARTIKSWNKPKEQIYRIYTFGADDKCIYVRILRL